MPRRSLRATQSDDEHSTPPTPRSPNHESHGRIEAWFENVHSAMCQSVIAQSNWSTGQLVKVVVNSGQYCKNG